jgi:hypothetical protein
MNRRAFLTTLLAAPAIIRTPGLLMPVTVPRFEVWHTRIVVHYDIDYESVVVRNKLELVRDFAGFPIATFREIPILLSA